MLVFGSVYELDFLCNTPPSVILFRCLFLLMNSVSLCNTPPSVALLWYSVLAYGFCSTLQLRLGGKLTVAASSLAPNHRSTPSIQVRNCCMLYIYVSNLNARLTLHSSSVVRLSLSFQRLMDLVTTGNRLRGLAGDSTACLFG